MAPLSARFRRGRDRDAAVGFHYLTAAVAGASVLIVEILGARMLAPYLGTSHFVWTAQIVVTLVALALGYDLGGRLADPVARPPALYLALLVAAGWLAGVAWLVEPIAWWCARLDLATGSLAASTALYFVPLTLLATVGPFLSRLLITDLRRVGGRVGRLLAVGTLGSVAGAALVGYVLIPLLPYPRALALTAAGLALLAGGGLVRERRRRATAAAAVLLLAALGSAVARDGSSRLPDGMVERAAENTPYGRLQVVDDAEGVRYMMTDFVVQNAYRPGTGRSASTYTYVLLGLARGYAARLDRALCVGMGMGAVPAELADDGVNVDVVEINPAVVRLAARWFDRDLESFRVHLADGRRFLREDDGTYDLVVLDAFSGDSTPLHLLTREAFVSARARLADGGIVLLNAFADRRPGLDYLAGSLHRTLGAVFRHVRVHALDTGNMFFVASDRELGPLGRGAAEAAPERCREKLRAALEETVDLRSAAGTVLTDAFHPVDFHDARLREALRRRFTEMMRPE